MRSSSKPLAIHAGGGAKLFTSWTEPVHVLFIGGAAPAYGKRAVMAGITEKYPNNPKQGDEVE
jgi:hypothetical protein